MSFPPGYIERCEREIAERKAKEIAKQNVWWRRLLRCIKRRKDMLIPDPRPNNILMNRIRVSDMQHGTFAGLKDVWQVALQFDREVDADDFVSKLKEAYREYTK